MSQSSNNVRSAPHIPGNWASYVYLEFDIDDRQVSILRGFSTDANPSLSFIEDIHVSLSKTFYAKLWHIDTLISKLTKAFCGIALPEALYFDHLATYTNENKTRSFIAMDCADETAIELKGFVALVDPILLGFGFESYYSDPNFHASFLWWSSEDISESLMPKDLPELIVGRHLKLYLKFGDRKIIIKDFV